MLFYVRDAVKFHAGKGKALGRTRGRSHDRNL